MSENQPSAAALEAMDNKYRKKPVVIEAHQWDGTYQDAERIKRLFPKMDAFSMNCHPGNNTVSSWSIRTLEGQHQVSPRDFIIQGVKGEYYPCKPDIFEATYEVAINECFQSNPEGMKSADEWAEYCNNLCKHAITVTGSPILLTDGRLKFIEAIQQDALASRDKEVKELVDALKEIASGKVPENGKDDSIATVYETMVFAQKLARSSLAKHSQGGK